MVDAAKRPERAATEGLAVVDRLDVADYPTELAHGYVHEPFPLPVKKRADWRVGDVAGATAVDAGRPVHRE